ITAVLVHNNKRALKQKAIQPATTVKNNRDNIDKPIKEQPVKEDTTPLVPPTPPLPPARSNNGLVVILSLLCCLFLGGFLWMLWKSNTAGKVQDTALPVELNPVEKRLSDSINNLQGTTLVLTDSSFAKEITISDT